MNTKFNTNVEDIKEEPTAIVQEITAEVVQRMIKVSVGFSMEVPAGFLSKLEENTAFIRIVLEDLASTLNGTVNTVDIS